MTQNNDSSNAQQPEGETDIVKVVEANHNKQFRFNKVFGGDCSQRLVFDYVQGAIDSVINGFNCTIFAYG